MDFGIWEQHYTDKLILICENGKPCTDDCLNGPYAQIFLKS